MNVVRLAERHLAGVADLEKACFSAPWSERALEMYLGGNAFAFVAEEDGAVLSYAGLQLAADEGNITNVATRPDARGRGYASLVLSALLAEAAARGAARVFLEVRESNEEAIRLYLRLGFSAVGKRKRFYSSPAEDAILMCKEVS